MNKIRLIIGGQFGSEGKGAFVQWLANQYEDSPMVVIRTGGPNAGHSMIRQGETIKMRQIPCAWENPYAQLMIGPGSVIDERVLIEEIILVENIAGKGYLNSRLSIDPNAVLIEPYHKTREAEIVAGIGSTGKGIGAATADRIMRNATLAGEGLQEGPLQKYVRKIPELFHRCYDQGYEVIIESSQGFGLSLTRSGYYPFATSRDLTPAQIINDAGIPHNLPLEVIAVFRTFPIRVAGPSGPMHGGEISWEELRERSGGYIEAERTTVTDKIRRVSEWDGVMAAESCFHVQPDWICLTFYDYVNPGVALQKRLMPTQLSGLHIFQKDLAAPIRWVGTGFGTIVELTQKEREAVKNGSIPTN